MAGGIRSFPFFSSIIVPNVTATVITTAGNVSLTAAQVWGGEIHRDPSGSNRTDTLPSAHDLAVAMSGIDVGSMFEIVIRNDGAQTITLAAGAGGTASGTMTIPQGGANLFRIRFTNITYPTEAYEVSGLSSAGSGGGGAGDALTTNPLSQFAPTTSAQLRGVISDETGTGAAVFAGSPAIITPTIASFANAAHSHLNAAGGGTITAGAISDLATAAIAFTNKSGAISQWTNDSGYLTSVSAHNLLSATHGDTLTDTVVRGDILYGNSTPKWARLAKPSVLSDLSHDGTDVSWVTATGTGAPVRAASPTFITSVLLPNGLVGTPSVGFGSEPGLGFYRSAGSTITFTASGSPLFTISSSGFYLPDAAQIGWSNGLFFQRDAYGVLALRNGSAAQKVRVYNTFTAIDTAGEWFKQDWQTTANQFRFGTAKGSSTGTARAASWDYGGTEASPSAAISVPITSGNIIFGGGVQLSNAAVTGLTAGVLAATTNATIVLYDSTGQAYRVPCII